MSWNIVAKRFTLLMIFLLSLTLFSCLDVKSYYNKPVDWKNGTFFIETSFEPSFVRMDLEAIIKANLEYQLNKNSIRYSFSKVFDAKTYHVIISVISSSTDILNNEKKNIFISFKVVSMQTQEVFLEHVTFFKGVGDFAYYKNTTVSKIIDKMFKDLLKHGL